MREAKLQRAQGVIEGVKESSLFRVLSQSTIYSLSLASARFTIKFLSKPSPDHIIENLQSYSISFSEKEKERFIIETVLNMKSFDGKLKLKSLISFEDTNRVCLKQLIFICFHVHCLTRD